MEENRNALGTTPEYEVEPEVVEHKTKVVESKKVLELGELLKVRCNICQIDNLFGRQNRKGEYLLDAWCEHLSFVGVVRPDD